MRHPLKDLSHHLKLLLAELRHTAERAIAPDQGLAGTSYQFSQLEERLMMSASPAAVIAAPEAVESPSSAISVDELLDQVFQTDKPANSNSPPSTEVSDSNQEANSAETDRELVIIDSAIFNPDEWIAGLRQDLLTDFDVLILSEHQDGFVQIADALDGGTLYSAIHVVSHGSDAQISLGQSTLNLNSLQQNESVLESWKAGLNSDADVLIYGCELAESEEGRQLVDSLSALWEADVAASDDLTGHQSLNGDWDLEYHSGLIQAPIAFSAAHTETWVGVLAPNAAPVNAIPDGQTILQDRILSFNDTNGNAISLSDSDVGANDLQLTLEASAGSFTITDIGTAEYTTGDGFEDATLVLQGTSIELNAALQNLHYTASDGFLGTVDITITTNDLGNGGAETPEQDSDVISVFVHDEFVTGGYTVADTAIDELNRNANRGVARSLAAAPNGNLIAVYRTAANDVFFAIHDNDNNLVASGQINDAGVAASDVAVAAGSDGDFVVAWSQDGGVDEDIFAQRYSSTGIAVGSQITVDSAVGIQQAVTIDRNAAGDFVIAWENTSDGIHVRRFAADGTAIDAGILSPTGGTGGTNASVGIDRDRNLLLGWDDSNGQYVQHFSSGVWGTKHTLSTLTFASGSAIGMTEDGQAVIAWHEQGANWAIRYQRIATDGSLDGAQDSAASIPAGDELNPSLAMDEEGNFVIAWETNGNIQTRQFAADGTALSGDFTVTGDASFKNNAAIAVLDINNFAVMFTRQTTDADVIVTRYNAPAVDAADPVIDLASRTVGAANSTITQRFLVGDDITDDNALNFGMASTNTSLIGFSDISVVGSGLYRELVITPTADMIGSSEITVTVTDGDGNVTQAMIDVFVASPFITVTTTADELDGNVSSILDLLANPGGTGISLREAITAANNTTNNGRRDRIHFDIPGGGQQTLSLTSELPVIREALFVDGQTQPGYSSSPLIGLNGNLINGNGLTIEADDVVVRGMAIFGFQQSGIDLDTGNGILIRDADDVTIYSNYIGVDQTGLTGDGNDRDGIRIVGESHDNLIGGEGAYRRNVISGNNANGITILGDSGAPSSTNEISFNFIGVGSDGATDVGNSYVGVDLRNTFQTQVLSNVISGNNDSGIEVTGSPTTETQILGNYIGVASDGTTALGNDGDGIALYTSVGQGPAQTKIGGVASGEANIIANNSFIGVRLDSGGGVGNSIRGNQIYANGAGLGIDLLGVSGNDIGDTDGGTNGQQNHPLLSAADLDGGDLTIQGTLNSTASTVFDIDIYSSAVADSSGSGEAETYVGTFSVTTDGSGNATFSRVIIGASTSAGHFITATATNSNGSTSEFGLNQIVAAPLPANTPPTISLANVLASVDENSDTSGGMKIADIVVSDDGIGTNDLSLTGSDAADFEIVGTELRLRSNVVLDYEQKTSLSVTVRVDDAALSGSPEDSVATTVTINDLNDTIPAEAFWFNTVADINNASGGTGATSWSMGDVVVLGDPNLTVGAGTNSGHFSSVFSLEGFTQDGSTRVSGMHVVGRDISVGTLTTVDLNAGDILFSTSTGEVFNGGTLATSQTDVVLFRPDSFGDYSSGTFSILLEGLGGNPSTNNLASFTLVEQTTTIGDTTVEAGDFLFVKLASFVAYNVEVYEVDGVGDGTTLGTATRLLSGADLGISGFSATISGLELVEETTTIGGETVVSGTLLLVSNNAPSDLATSSNDIFALDVTQTDIGSGTTVASSSLVVRGDDFGLTWLSSLSLGHQPAEVSSFSAVADAYISKGSGTTNFGGSASIVVDKSGGNLGDERALFRFDLSGLPADAVITSAELVLNATAISAPFDINVYEVTESWDENTVTYDDRSTGQEWGTDGGTVDSTVLDTFSATTTGNHVWDITSLAAAWKDGSKDNNGVLLGTPDTGTDDVTYSSKEGAVAPQLIITYTSATPPANDPPIADIGGPYVINEGSSLSLDASGSSDPDSDGLTYAWDLDNDGAFDDATGVSPIVAWASLPSGIRDDGTFTIRVSVSDGTNPAQIETASLTISNLDPSGNADSGAGFSTDEDTAFTTGSVIANDTDPAGSSDPLQITAVDTTGTTGLVSIASGNTTFEYNPNGQFEYLRAGESATDTFSYTVSDGDGGTASNVTVTVVVNGVNDQPTSLTLNNLTLAENSNAAVVGQLATEDSDSTDSHTYTVDDARFEISGINLRLKAGQAVDFESEPTIDVEVVSTDVAGAQITRSFTITVGDANDVAPIVTSGQVFGILDSASNGTSVGSVAATDIDTVGTLQAYSIDSGDAAGVFNINATTGAITLADASLLDGGVTPFYDLLISVSDGVTRSPGQTIRVNVTATNTNPVAVDDSFTVNEGQTINGSAGANWFNDDWQYRQEITIDNSGVGSALTDYPLRLRFHATDVAAINIDYSRLNGDGSDLLFVDPDGTLLAYEIERWDPAGYSDVWVKVPVIDGGATDSITMYYSSSAVNPSPAAATTWDSTDAAVLHLDNDAVNSSGQTLDGTIGNVTAVAGQSGQAYSFNGTDSEIRLAADGDINNVFNLGGTISAWIHPTGWGENGYGRILDKAATTFSGGANEAGWSLQIGQQGGAGELIFENGFSANNGRWRTALGSIDLNQWQHVAVVYDSSDTLADPEIYLNGVLQTLTQTSNPIGTELSDAANDLVVGNYSQAQTRTFDGLIDEVRVSITAATAAEVQAEFRDIDSPVVSAGSLQTGPGLLHNDLDADGDTLSVSLISGPDHAGFFQLLADGSFIYTHDGTETTDDSFVYRISDGVATSTATVSLTVEPQNDSVPEVTTGQAFSLSESSASGTAVGTVVGADGDLGTTLSGWSITSGNGAGHFQIDSSTGQITLTPSSNLDYEVQTSFSLGLTVSDGVNTSAIETVSVQLTDQNDNTPVVTPGLQFSVSETSSSGTSVGTVTATDVDTVGSLTNWTIASGNAAGHFQINASTGAISLSPSSSLDFENQNTFSLGLTVSDGVNTSAIQSVLVGVTDQNDSAPIVTPAQAFDVAETASAGTVLGTITATDADAGDTVSNWTIVSGNADGHFVLDGVTGQLRIASGQTLNYNTTDTYLLGVTATDGTNSSASETVTVRVSDVDLPPSISAISNQAILEDAAATTVSFHVLDSDTAAGDLIVTAVSSNNGLIQTSSLALSGTGSNRQLSFTPVANEFGGSATITVTVSDGTTSVAESFDVVVAAVNDAPLINPIATQTVNEDGSLAISFSATDIDTALSVLTVSASSSDASLVAAAGLQFSGNASAAVLNVTPESDQFGAVEITVTVSDGMDTNSTTFLLNVTPINDAPTLSNPNVELTVGERSLSISKTQFLTGAADIDSSDLQLVLDAGPLNGRLVEVSPGEYSYTPDVGFLGQDRFVYSVSDGALQSGSRIVNLEVLAAVPSPKLTNSMSRTVTTGSGISSNDTIESSSDSVATSETASETVSNESTGLVSNETAVRGSIKTTESGPKEAGGSEDSSETAFGKIDNQLNDGFVFRKLITVDEAGGRVVGAVLVRDEISRSEQKDGRRNQNADQELSGKKFDQSDWQYYSDLKSTVGGVQVFRENLQDEFAFSDLTTGTITLASTGAAVGFVVTAVRSGMLALGFLSQLPVWTLFDPLMVVDGVTGDDADEDSIRDIVDRQSASSDSGESDDSPS